MAALVQTYQQSGTTTILQARPNSSAGIMPSHSSHNSSSQPYMGHAQRSSYNGLAPAASGGQQSYRGSSAPVQPYAFMSTPNLAATGQWPQQQQQQQYGAYRGQPSNMPMSDSRSRHNQSSSFANTAANANMTNQSRPQSAAWGGAPGQPTFAQVAASKASPERYRRPTPKTTETSPSIVHQNAQTPGAGPGSATVVHLYNPRTVAADRKMDLPRNSAQLPSRPQSMLGSSVDDMHVHRHRTEEEAKRFRRRSMHSIDMAEYSAPLTPQDLRQGSKAGTSGGLKKHASNDREQMTIPRIVSPGTEKTPTHVRTGSSESLVSSRSSNSRPSSSANRTSNASAAPTSSPASTSTNLGDKASGQDQNKSLNVPPRGSSSNADKRVPSPLSKPTNMAGGTSSATTPAKPPTSSHGAANNSPAAQQLAAINEKGGKSKSKTSRLRRAFSFGSAAELKQVTGQTDEENSRTQPADAGNKLQKEPGPDDLYEQEQQRIAQQQEESGIGSSIYSGTKLFAGSTDNLSISSTASSASIMLRKMGRGVKKSSRSLVGLFRPKSIIGAPVGDPAAPEATPGAVSMITVEAERERVNVNADPHSQPAGGTGFPKLERNSVDASKADIQPPERLGSSGTDNSAARKSIVGGEKERAEVLATIRKGILKTSRSESPTPSTRGEKGPAFELPAIPNVSDSPNSSAPSTPNDDTPGHKRSSSIAIGNEDYFMSALRLRQDTKSAPSTPQGTMGKRNATFSPRIVFHDTWPSGEYDRRGEIATCNRLTPMLAQQIKEELNSFKMEMEVHETSKIYTHFF